jgi:2-polyprenyl-3-methyl-5-hydroxy-6-metoxy-1,4-benzoquinol methylase
MVAMDNRAKSAWRWAALPVAILAVLAVLPFVTRDWTTRERSEHHFDRIFQGLEGTSLFSLQPNAYMMRMLEGRPAGRALDVAMGQGRNALWLATKGWDVTGFDISQAGLDAATASAKSLGVPLRTMRESVDDFDYGRERWDLVLLIYAPVRYESKELMKRIRDSIKPGGLVIVEDEIEWSAARKDPRPPGSLSSGELREIFSDGYRILDLHEVQAVSEWFPRLTLLGRLTAQRQ